MKPVVARREPPAPDMEVLDSIVVGDLSSLGLLFDRYGRDVRRFIARLGVAPGDIDDLTQATFLVVVDAAAHFRGGGSARAWLFGLAANLVRRHRRSMARLAARLAAWAHEPGADAYPTPADTMTAHERSAFAARALAQLSPKKREVFVMVALEGLAADAVAEALGVPIGTVWTRLHHARRELRARLEEEAP